jgi:hypothetical protein
VIDESELIPSLQEPTSFLAEKYNERKQQQEAAVKLKKESKAEP